MKKVVAFLVMAVLPALFSKPALFAGPTDTNSPNGNIEQTNKQDNPTKQNQKLTHFEVDSLQVTSTTCNTLQNKGRIRNYPAVTNIFIFSGKNNFGVNFYVRKIPDIKLPKYQEFKNKDEILEFIGDNFAGEHNKKIFATLINKIGKENIGNIFCQDLKNGIFLLGIHHKYPYIQINSFATPYRDKIIEKMKELHLDPKIIITSKNNEKGFIVISSKIKHKPANRIDLSRERNKQLAKSWEITKNELISYINDDICFPPEMRKFPKWIIENKTNVTEQEKEEMWKDEIRSSQVASSVDREIINLSGKRNFIYEVIIDTTNPAKTYSDLKKSGAFWGQITKNKTGGYKVKAYYNMKLHPEKLFE